MTSVKYLSAAYTAAMLSSKAIRHLCKTANFDRSSQYCFGTTSGMSQQSAQDLYEILGVEKTATAKDIKAAYYELSKKYHPDTGGSQQTADARRFHQITDAYETLGNDEKRKAYDEEQAKIIFNVGGDYKDADLEMLRELQRKWNLRRRHYAQSQTYQRMRSEFEIKHDKEEFESFYRRYRENVAKAQRWDENVHPTTRWQQGVRREQYTEFQKEHLRRQHQQQMEHAASGSIFLAVLLVTVLLLFIFGGSM